MTPLPEPEQMMTTRQVAELFQVHIDTVRAWINSGDLRAIRIGQKWRIPRSEFTRYANERFGE